MDIAQELRDVQRVLSAVDERLETVQAEGADAYTTAYQVLALLDMRVETLIRAERILSGTEDARAFHPAIQMTMSRLLAARERVDTLEARLMSERQASTLH